MEKYNERNFRSILANENISKRATLRFFKRCLFDALKNGDITDFDCAYAHIPEDIVKTLGDGDKKQKAFWFYLRKEGEEPVSEQIDVDDFKDYGDVSVDCEIEFSIVLCQDENAFKLVSVYDGKTIFVDEYQTDITIGDIAKDMLDMVGSHYDHICEMKSEDKINYDKEMKTGRW